jgi:hypothetical protein
MLYSPANPCIVVREKRWRRRFGRHRLVVTIAAIVETRRPDGFEREVSLVMDILSLKQWYGIQFVVYKNGFKNNGEDMIEQMRFESIANLSVSQLQLNILTSDSSELSEEVQKVLSTENRHLPQNLVIFSFKDGAYIPIPKTSNVVTIFEYDGTAIHIDSAEAKAQIARDGGEMFFKNFNPTFD